MKGLAPGGLRPKIATSAVVLGWLATTFVAADSPAERPVDVLAAGHAAAIRVDGALTEPAWQSAPVLTGFLQRAPREGDPATHPTEVRLLSDASAIYVGITALDSQPGRIVGHLTRRDEDSPSDWLRVFIDSANDRRSAYEFSVNPAGVRQDRYWFNDTDNDRGWDAVWDVAVMALEQGWQAEFRIPFSQLRRTSRPDGHMGFMVMREVARLGEISCWPLVAQSRAGFVSQFGQVMSLAPGVVTRRLELVPYAVSKATLNPGGTDVLTPSRDVDALGGLDLKYGVTSGLTLTATINPDFGQVEADPAVVNLSAFETFFPERRPFFVEGSGNFRFDLSCEDDRCSGLFYSRRIGRTPQATPDVPAGGTSRMPTQTTILGAGKLTGKIGPYAIGVMHAVTQEERAQVWTPAGGTRSAVVEPLTSYTALRARREFGNQSNLGAMFTATHRSLPTTLEDVLATQAYTGGIDVDWRLTSRYRVTGYWAGSRILGHPAAISLLQQNSRHAFQRPDADHLELDPDRRVLSGHAAEIALGKNGGERVRFRAAAGFRSPGFDINDLGYLRRADERSQSTWLQWRFPTPTSWYRSLRLNFNQWSSWNFGGDLLYAGANVNGHVEFRNQWRAGVGVSWNAEGFDDRLTRGGPGGYRPARSGVWAIVNTDTRRAVAMSVSGFAGSDRHGRRDLEAGFNLVLRPTSALMIEPGVSWARNDNEAQWVANVTRSDGGPSYVFGAIDQRTAALTLRVNYALGPTMSLQLYAQPFVSAADYHDYKELVDGRAARFEDRYQAIRYPDTADFRYSSLRSTNVFRWEYRPGSTLFVVWQQGREQVSDSGEFRFGRDLGHVFTVPAQNVFLVKLAYWLNL